MKKIIFVLMVVFLILTSAGILFSQEEKPLEERTMQNAMETFFNGHVWVKWEKEEKFAYVTAYLTACNKASIIYTGYDGDKIGSMPLKSVLILAALMEQYYEDPNTRDKPIYYVLMESFLFMRDNYF